MYAERHEVVLVTDNDGNAVGFTPVVRGRVLGVRYVKDDFADGVDFAVTLEATGENVWTEEDVNASKSVYPRAQVHGTDGVGLAYADGGEPVAEPVVAVHDRVKIAVASGEANKRGVFHVVIG